MRYFSKADFACKHCGENKMSEPFMNLIDELRHRCQFPIAVTSGYRCPAHNQKVSTTGPNGPHTTGLAADLAVSRHRAWDVLRVAMEMKFTGIGVNQKGNGRFIHLDMLREPDHAPRPSVWSY